jgi:hypothetical protein
MKVCPKMLKIEEQREDGTWKYYSSILRPVNATAAERLTPIYNLPADVAVEIQREIENPIPYNPLAWRNL